MNKKLSTFHAIVTIFLLISLLGCAVSKNTTTDLNIHQLIRPLSKDGIFRDTAYYNWGGSIIKGEEEKYHLFYSRWKREYQQLHELLADESLPLYNVSFEKLLANPPKKLRKASKIARKRTHGNHPEFS